MSRKTEYYPDPSSEEEDEEEQQDERRVCPYCNGTTLSPYPDDGGSCPHCFGGYLPG
jgi:hypothetical protein